MQRILTAVLLVTLFFAGCASQQQGSSVAAREAPPVSRTESTVPAGSAGAAQSPGNQKDTPSTPAPQATDAPQGPAPNAQLEAALKARSLPKLKDALSHGANANALVERESWAITDATADNRVSPLFAVLDWYDAPEAQKEEAVKLLAAAGADPRAATPAGFTLIGAFISACTVTINGKPLESTEDSLAFLRALLDIGADPDQGTRYQYILDNKTVTTTIAPLLRLEGYASLSMGLRAGIIRLLIQYHADPHPLSPSGDTGLELCLMAISRGELPLVNAYLDAGVDANAKELAALVYVASPTANDGVDQAAARMITRSSHLGDYDRYGKAFIHAVAGNWDQPDAVMIRLVDLYAAAKGDFSLPDGNGATPFMLAIGRNHLAVARELVRLGADPRKPGPTGATALHSIARESMEAAQAIALADAVLGYGVSVNQRDASGRTALAIAAESDAGLDFIKHLVTKGADPAIPDIDGCTAMGTAKNMGNTKIIAYLTLLKVPSYSGGWPVGNASPACKAVLAADLAGVQKMAAADFEAVVARTADGVPATALHLAVESGSLPLIAALSAKPVNWNVGDRYGRTPLEIAVTQGRGDVVKALLAAGADPNRQGNRGESAYGRAISAGSPLLDTFLGSSKAPSWDSVSAVLLIAGSIDVVRKLSSWARWSSDDYDLAAFLGRTDVFDLLGGAVRGTTRTRTELLADAAAARDAFAAYEAAKPLPVAADPSAVRDKPGSYTLTLLRWSPWMDGDPALDLKKYPVAVYVPKGYDGSQPYGLVISMMNAKSASQFPKPEYVASLDKHRLIYVGFDPYNGVFENGSADYMDTNHERLCLAAACAIFGSYAIDRSRVYLTGFSWGGRLTGEIVPKQPRVFTGGIAVGGCFTTLTGGRIIPSMPYARRNTVMVLDTGDYDFNRQETYNGYDTFLTLGYEAFFIQEPKEGHTRISAANFEKALTLLDEGTKGKGQRH